ncbi:cellulose synthase-like protein E6 [Tasmannia lanceolata]|uniref:cellulose synthase-like protein E6 n=1 Tax=Tasmannia lanceolata TaxID=3420 RepID=UPI004064621B
MRRDGRAGYFPLFETEGRGSSGYKLFAVSIFVGICWIWVYRVSHIPTREEGRWVWLGLFAAEIWFAFYWILTQAVRWNPVHRHTFKDRLSQRYESELPGVDIFVCTADPIIEPPVLVINTVLSVMAYDYPPEKLSVYLSDDGGSDLTFYALLEASRFSKHWIPFSKKFKVEPRSPAAYFSTTSDPHGDAHSTEQWSAIKKMYKDMENRIETTCKLGRIPEDIREEHKGFSEWSSTTTSRNHQSILQILIDGRDPNAVDNEGSALPTLVYLAREKRPQHPHNFKAGAMNALIRVSSEISNGQIILNVDCDMYSNNSESVRDALCFFMDEEKGHDIGFVQFPQSFNNLTKNDLYASSLRIVSEVDLPGFDGYGGPLYIGTGCFHRRVGLFGKKYSNEYKEELKEDAKRRGEESVSSLEERVKGQTNCTYEKNTQWGKQVGLKYGCSVEDVITGLSIQCNGWKSIYFNPPRKGFLGVAPTTLSQSLVQHKRWAEGDLQIFLSKYCPFICGQGKIKPGLQMGYSIYCFWAPCSIPTLYYVAIPSLCLLSGVSLFPKISSPWCIPFLYVITAKFGYGLGESLWFGETIKGWLNEQRMWLMKRTTSYLFAVIDNVLKLLGFSESAFVITTKVADHEASKRYEQEIMEFGSSSPMFTILATLALLQLLSMVGGVIRVVLKKETMVVEALILQFLLCGLLVFINIPIYQALFFRKDKGRLPSSLSFTSFALALLFCLVPLF